MKDLEDGRRWQYSVVMLRWERRGWSAVASIGEEKEIEKMLLGLVRKLAVILVDHWRQKAGAGESLYYSLCGVMENFFLKFRKWEWKLRKWKWEEDK